MAIVSTAKRVPSSHKAKKSFIAAVINHRDNLVVHADH